MNTTNLINANNSFVNSSQKLWNGLVDYVPTILFAIIIFIIGLVLASVLGSLVTTIIRKLKVDKILSTVGIKERLQESNINLTISGSMGWLTKWFIIIATMLTVSDILKLNTVSEFLGRVLAYIPNVIVAIIILTIGLIVGNFISELVEKSITASDFLSNTSVKALQLITKWTIVLFALMAALLQLNIAESLLLTLFAGMVFMFALAGGIAFGLGGKNKAEEVIEKIFKK